MELRPKTHKKKYDTTTIPPFQEFLRPSHRDQLRHIISSLTDMILADIDDEMVYVDIREARTYLEAAYFKIMEESKKWF